MLDVAAPTENSTTGIVFALVAALVGILGLLLAWITLRRDRAKVVVDLDWDTGKHYVGMRSNVKETWGTITVTNRGRRAIFVRSVGLKYPDDEKVYNLLPQQDQDGVKLEEGDKPIVIKIPQNKQLQRYSANWKEIYAVADTASGRRYRSTYFPAKRPSWAE